MPILDVPDLRWNPTTKEIEYNAYCIAVWAVSNDEEIFSGGLLDWNYFKEYEDYDEVTLAEPSNIVKLKVGRWETDYVKDIKLLVNGIEYLPVEVVKLPETMVQPDSKGYYRIDNGEELLVRFDAEIREGDEVKLAGTGYFVPTEESTGRNKFIRRLHQKITELDEEISSPAEISTASNKLLLHDIIRHTVTSAEANVGSFTESWNKVASKKIVNIHSGTVAENEPTDVYTSNDRTAGGSDNAHRYDGTGITVTDQNGVWAANDVVTIYLVYEK